MAITPNDLGGDENTARRVLVLARSIAPCLDSISDDERKADAIAILKGVLDELPEAGSKRMRSVSRNGTSMAFSAIESAFDEDARRALRSLCESQSHASSVGLPVGSFPALLGTARVWPEGDYT